MNKQTKIIVGIALAAIVGGGIWFLYTGRTEVKFARVTPAQATKAAEVLSRDQDNDGLKDWEEELWHTDALNPDTDGDATKDGEEIKLGRDPVRVGPNDVLDKETIEQKTVPGGGDWSETDRLSREFFGKYLAMKQSGAPFTAEDEQKLLEEFVGRYPESQPKKTYTESDIVLAPNDDNGSLKAYGNAIGAVINAHKDKEGVENELIIFERALENEDEIDLANLEERIKRYESLLAGLKAVPSPKSVVEIHTALLNSAEALKESVSGMALAFTDPVRSLSAATAYPQAIEKLTDAFIQLAALFKEKEITFGEEEAGYILTK